MQIVLYDLEKGETMVLGSAPAQTITALYWTPLDDALIVDDGDHTTPIWAVGLEGAETAEVLIEAGTLLNVIPKL